MRSGVGGVAVRRLMELQRRLPTRTARIEAEVENLSPEAQVELANFLQAVITALDDAERKARQPWRR